MSEHRLTRLNDQVHARAGVMSGRPAVWLVVRDEEPVAELEIQRFDPPWFCGGATRRPGFRPLQALFDREQRLARRVHHNPASWAGAYRQLRREVQLIRPDGHPAPEFILHIDGGQARWRCWNHETTNWLYEQLDAIAPKQPAPQRIVGYLLAAMMGALLAALALPGGALAHALHHRRSANWAGYAATTAQPFRSVSGSWVQPTANCDQHMTPTRRSGSGSGGSSTPRRSSSRSAPSQTASASVALEATPGTSSSRTHP
jgi:hypothetical protein